MRKSPFLDRIKLLENEVGFVIYDQYPVSPGHSLIIPNRVYADYFDSTDEEIEGLHKLVFDTKKLLDEELKPAGYNIGINAGEASGQTIAHMHIHIIPRFIGDVNDPTGGVRGVIPGKQNY